MMTEEKTMSRRIRTHPGEILALEFLEPLSLSSRALAQAIGVPANRISDLARGRRDVTADTAIRLGRYFQTGAQFWLNLQAAHDLTRAEAEHDYSAIAPRAEIAA
jgi:addiction module HigA family antidote